MADTSKLPKSITVAFEEAPGKPTFAVTGAYGGPSPDGAAIIAHMYVEFTSLPSLEELSVSPSGEVKTNEGKALRRTQLTRMVQATLVFPPEVAERVGAFLQEKAQLVMTNRAKAVKPKS